MDYVVFEAMLDADPGSDPGDFLLLSTHNSISVSSVLRATHMTGVPMPGSSPQHSYMSMHCLSGVVPHLLMWSFNPGKRDLLAGHCETPHILNLQARFCEPPDPHLFPLESTLFVLNLYPSNTH